MNSRHFLKRMLQKGHVSAGTVLMDGQPPVLRLNCILATVGLVHCLLFLSNVSGQNYPPSPIGSGVLTNSDLQSSGQLRVPSGTTAENMESPEEDLGILGADAGFRCPPRWYAVGETMFLNREGDGGVTLSEAGGRLRGFDYMMGTRIRIGHTRDCLDGWEFTYVGPFRWHRSSRIDGTLLNINIVNPDGFDLSAFNGAVTHQQDYRSDLQNFELMRKWWGWDVFSVGLGFRYLTLQEGFWFNSVDSNGDLGLLAIDTDNDVVHLLLDIHLMMPIGRLTLGGKLNGGAGVNINHNRFRIINAGTPIIENSDTSGEFSFMIQGGYYGIYRVTPNISTHIGYEAWYLWGLAIPVEQEISPLRATTGRAWDEHGDLFFHGATAGVEIVW